MKFAWVASLVLCSATVLVAADVSGAWSGKSAPKAGVEPAQVFLTLKQNGSKLEGTGGPSAVQQFPIQNGTTDGARVVFELRVSATRSFYFDVKADGDQMTGKMTTDPEGKSGSSDITLKRAAAK